MIFHAPSNISQHKLFSALKRITNKMFSENTVEYRHCAVLTFGRRLSIVKVVHRFRVVLKIVN
jgi:hypothetical protein